MEEILELVKIIAVLIAMMGITLFMGLFFLSDDICRKLERIIQLLEQKA